ncbi:putative DNA-binding transcriptional regulator YafY [Kribbella sp. VKM Ac-2527]|uniref:Putative DNA-binding transcriptional regulator YafY n=1 Tax=Kribbella caucasensis TaxID=2512215 RepID=A0A4V3CB78_9ACTN|nr:WYL domain-containing protein [Kribbella sp. VKM Ac-2527]TDO54770.1 putative DNA-binding transcriptional regulator YafY [Kribbella sp. VKM Ac-2527]
MNDLPGRLLRLLSLLQSRREWSGRELAERLGVTDRTVRRDVERLRSLDYPVTGTTGTAGGYRLASGRNMPPLILDADEVVAVAAGLATVTGIEGIEDSAMSALAKLEQVLPARHRPQVAALGESSVAPHLDLPRIDAQLLASLASCCRDSEIIAFDYESRSGASSSRRVEPHQLVAVHGQWYLLAYDPERADWRTFRVDRISSVRPSRHHFTPRELPAPDALSYLEQSFATASYRHSVTLWVQLPADELRRNFYRWWLPGTVEADGVDSCVVRLTTESPELLIQYVAAVVALGAEFTMQAPEQTAALIRDVGLRLASGA